jgi:hypothetical protein
MGDFPRSVHIQNDRKQETMTVKPPSVQLALLAFCCIASVLPLLSLAQSGKPSKVHTYYIARTKANGTMHLMESTR